MSKVLQSQGKTYEMEIYDESLTQMLMEAKKPDIMQQRGILVV